MILPTKEKIKINNKYLNHKLEKFTKHSNLDYKCDECNVVIYFSDGCYYDVDFSIDEDGDVDSESTLTCEQHIIKSIIE